MSSFSSTATRQQFIETELYELQKDGVNVISYLNELINKHEEEEKKTNENTVVSLLADFNANALCAKGHTIDERVWIHLRALKCSQCNNSHVAKTKAPNAKHMDIFLNEYASKTPTESGYGGWFRSKGYHKKYPLHYAAAMNDANSIRKICQESKTCVSSKMADWADWQPIHWTGCGDQFAALVELIKQGADAFANPAPDGTTLYGNAVYYKRQKLVEFLNRYAELKYNINIKHAMFECYHCYIYDLKFHQEHMDQTMGKYIYCGACAVKNKAKVKQKMYDDAIVQKRLIRTLKTNPQISIDTLCEMKDKVCLEYLLKDIVASGFAYDYLLFLFDVDNFKTINSALTHHGADIKLQQIGEIMKKYEKLTEKDPQYWKKQGIEVEKLWTFRQGGDEYAMVVKRVNFENIESNVSKRYYKIGTLQKLYELIRKEINEIQIGKTCQDKHGKQMKNIQLSVGVYLGSNEHYNKWLEKADEAAETVKANGKNGIRVCQGESDKIYDDFTCVY